MRDKDRKRRNVELNNEGSEGGGEGRRGTKRMDDRREGVDEGLMHGGLSRGSQH